MALKTIEMVRKIRDQLNEEMKDASVSDQLLYIRKKAIEARRKMSRLQSSKKIKSSKT